MANGEHVPTRIDNDDALVRLGRVQAGLRMAVAGMRLARSEGSPNSPLRQPLDEKEHEGHWLTRRQILELSVAISTVDRILARLVIRMDPRCPTTLGERPGWMSSDQYDPCRCLLPRDHAGAHVCEHMRTQWGT